MAEKQVSAWTARGVLRIATLGQRRMLLHACSLLGLHQVAEATVPVVVGLTIGRAVSTGDSESLARWMVALFGLYLVLTFSMRMGLRANVQASQEAGHKLRKLLTNRILDDRSGTAFGQTRGTLLSTATSDATTVGALNESLATAASGLAGLIVAGAVLIWVSTTLAVLVFAGTLLLLFATSIISRPMEERSSAERAVMADAAALATDLIRGLRVLKGFGGEPVAAQRYSVTSQRAVTATIRTAMAESIIAGFAMLLASALLVAAAFVGGRMATRGDISVAALISVLGISQYTVEPLTRLVMIGAPIARARASAQRIADALNTPFAVQSGVLGDPVTESAIHLDSVRHGPLQALQLEIAAGSLVGIVTSSPTEAATLMDCLARELEPDSGTLLVGGKPVRDLSLDSLKSGVVVMPHDAYIFEGSLKEVVGSPKGTLTLSAVMTASSMHDVVEALPDGIDTSISAGGASLSGGQRQRLVLARALAIDSTVLVLHEPTTALDSLTEANIAQGLQDIRRGKTTVIITSSPTLLAACDQVFLVAEGRVAESGTHATLSPSSQRYRDLVLT